MKIKFIIISLVVLFSFNLKAQGEAALPVLTLNPDPQSLAMGWGGAANVSAAPTGYYYNPALLGYYSQNTNLSYQTYAEMPEWIPAFTSSIRLNRNSFTAGYKFQNVMRDFSLSAGFGYQHFKFGYGYLYIYNNNNMQLVGESFDKYDAYTFGLSLDYFVNLSFGMSFKSITSQGIFTTAVQPDGFGVIKINPKARDWGLLLDVPILKLLNKDLIYKTGTTELKPYINFGLGYSRTNIGDKVIYIDTLQKDPLPLTAHLGYNLSFGTDIKLFDNSFRLVDVNLMIDASDILIKYDPFNGKSYQSGLGDINIVKNLIRWKATDKSLIRKGRSLTLLETVSLLGGGINGPGYPEGRGTSGVVVSSGGLFKLLSSVVFDNDYYTKFILSHLELRYVHATTFENLPFTSNLSSFSIVIKNLSF